MRKWLRRGLLALGLVGLVLGGAVALALRKGQVLPPAPPQARVKPALSGLPPLKVCWLETSRTVALPITASGLLIRHPQGEVLVDAGNSPRFNEEIEEHPFGIRLWMKAFPGQLKPKARIGELLRAQGVEPERVRVILSHSHLDHAGGLMDLPPVPVLVPQPELDFLRSHPGERALHFIPAQAERVLAQARPIAFEPRPYETFSESADLFGDGSVVLVPLYGHTPGSVGIFVNLSAQRRLFHVGDSIDELSELSPPRAKSFGLALTDYEKPRAYAVVSRLAQLQELAPELRIIPAHDRRAWQAFFGDAPGCVE